MASVFYFSGLILLLLNFLLLANYTKYVYIKEFLHKFIKVTGKKPEKSDFSENYFEFFSFVHFVESLNFFWFFFGLIGSNWLIFVSYFILYSILNIIVRWVKVKFISDSFLLLKLLFTFSTLTLLVFNHFHLHLNLTTFITNFFN
jgi:hypothetical protein